MMTTILSLLAFSLLFAVFGVMRRTEPACGGNCGACESACEPHHLQDEP
jgi:hypothetical protein